MSSESHRVVDDSGRLWVWYDDYHYAKYCYLKPQNEFKRVVLTDQLGGGIQIDYDAEGEVIGLEFV